MSKEHAYAYEAGYRDGSINYELEHCPACKNVADLQEALAENAKLRELAVLQSVIFKHMSTCPTTDCQACPVNDECAESVYLEGVFGIDDKETSWLVQWRSEDAADVRAENAKLRELARAAWRCIHTGASCSDCRLIAGGCTLQSAMRELRIEVEQ